MTEHQSSSEADHSRVAPTAWGVAYLRSLSDIPLADTVFAALESRLVAEGQASPAWDGDRDYLAPQLEARYKLVEQLLDQTNCTQVLELAAGVATHGINRTTADPESQYIELDLPGVITHKRAVLRAGGLTIPDNLKIVSGDVLNVNDLRAATANLDKAKPLVVMNEGLLRYLSFEEKATVARNVKAILQEFGGFWITPDSNLREAMSREDEKANSHTARVSKKTGIDIGAYTFASEEDSVSFYEALGFNVEKHSFLEVTDQLVTPERLGMTAQEVRRLNEPCVSYVMTLKDTV